MKKRKIGLFILMLGSVFMGCPSEPPVDQTITLLAIPGVIAPVRGATPITTAINTTQYTGNITWTPADNPYSATTVYTANIVLTEKAGWTLTGVTANSFTVEGAATKNAPDSGSVAAVFPATGNNYTSANIGTLIYIPAGGFQRDATASNISVITQPLWMSPL